MGSTLDLVSVPPTFIKSSFLREEGVGRAGKGSKLPTWKLGSDTQWVHSERPLVNSAHTPRNTRTHEYRGRGNFPSVPLPAGTSPHRHTLQTGSARVTTFYCHSTSPQFSVSPSLGRCAHSASPSHTPTALTSGAQGSGPGKTGPLQIGKAIRLRKGVWRPHSQSTFDLRTDSIPQKAQRSVLFNMTSEKSALAYSST